ncbi:carboxypeptidase-like regulatory domain-containing protein [candidate division KSB1 bacterium]|nr:carboxypeptidase-like regulatory domain-containing protein [candidate division KSB1 bacterium]
MTRKSLYLQIFAFILMLLIVISAENALAAITGKIAGRVVDKESGTALPGANVMIDGTFLGAAADAKGEYFIINIPAGSYSVKATMMGYEVTTKTNVLVMTNRTTQVNFTLSPTVIEGTEVSIVAERPLVELDVTGTQTVINSSLISRAPVTDLEDLVSQQNGIINTGMVSTFRGGELKEVSYMLDGSSTDYGVLQDQFKKINTTAIQEVTLLTGGYNAEYGNAMSGVVNVVTKEASMTKRNIHGNIKGTLRPAGLYHWGTYLFDENLHRIADFPVSYWSKQLESAAKQKEYAEYYRYWYGWDGQTIPTAQQLYDTHIDQVLGNQEVADYNQRSQKEIEGSIYGSFLENSNFLASFNYLRGVHIYPTRLPYQDSYNGIFKFNYYLNKNMKLSANYMRAYHKMSAYNQSGVMGLENNRVHGLIPGESRDPNDMRLGEYGYWGGAYRLGNDEMNMDQMALKWQHTINPSTFYNIDLTYTRSENIIAQDYSKGEAQNAWADQHFGYTADSPWPRDGYVGFGQKYDKMMSLTGELRVLDMNWLTNFGYNTNALNIKGDITSQITNRHQIKGGAQLILHDLDHIAIQHDWRQTTPDKPYAGQVFANVWDAKPTELGFFLQDKMEYEGIILNIGLRLDAYNANYTYPENPLFDPMGVEKTTKGYEANVLNSDYMWFLERELPDWAYWPRPYENYMDLSNKPDYAKYTLKAKNSVKSTWKAALSPRLGISFPVSESSKIFFSYGQFNMRPSFNAICGRPISFLRQNPLNTIGPNRQFGYTGHDGLTYQTLVQFELGYNQSFFDLLRVSATGYYKDYEKLTNLAFQSEYGEGGIAVSGNSLVGADMYVSPNEVGRTSFHTSNNVLANKGFRESRGVEMSIEKLFDGLWSAAVNMDYGVTSAANYGLTAVEEKAVNQSKNSVGSQAQRDDIEARWMSDLRIRANASLVSPKDFAGFASPVLGEITFALYYEYFKGPTYTYYESGYAGLAIPDNKTWFPHQRTDLKITKVINLGGIKPYLGIQVNNLFNNYDRILLSGSELDAWEQKDQPPLESKEGEANIWRFYNSYANPKRMIYFTLGIEF